MNKLNPITTYLTSCIDQKETELNDKKITVNPLVAEVASWYEKLRTAMDYRNEGVILCSAVERILKRRFLTSSDSDKTAGFLIKELAWARYFPDNTVPESIVAQIGDRIRLYTKLFEAVKKNPAIARSKIDQWIMQVMSADISFVINPNKESQLVANYMFHRLKDKIEIEDDSEESTQLQLFIAVHRAFAREEQEILRYHLFLQVFGNLEEENLSKITGEFGRGYQDIENALRHPLQNRIFSYIKKQTPPFIILLSILKKHRGNTRNILNDEDSLKLATDEVCKTLYYGIYQKVRRAVVRSIIFLLVTKAIIALAIEGSFENLIYGKVMWRSIAANTLVPPVLMFVTSFFIKTPSQDNTEKIWVRIKSMVYQKDYSVSETLRLKLHSPQNTISLVIFWIVWLAVCIGVFTLVVVVLSKLKFSIISQLIFLFFLAVVSFLSYMINQTAREYTVGDEKEGIKSLIFNFFFLPFIQVGRHITLGISQFNVILVFFDLLIEAPFKVIFGFFEDWFLFLRVQKENLER